MKPKTEKVKKKKKKKKKTEGDWEEQADKESEDIKLKKKMFPGLALPDDPNVRVLIAFITIFVYSF